jgi:succinyl-CoA synthetase beta subunit
MMSHTYTVVSGEGRALADEYGVNYTGAGVNLGLRALAHVFMQQQFRTAVPSPVASPGTSRFRPDSERAVLNHLAAHGVPVIPGAMAASANEAAEAARAFGGPVVLKISSPDIQHKSDLGGVALNVFGDDVVKAAYDEMIARVSSAKPEAKLEGVIVSPMRKGGVELFVGTMRDPQWGAAIAVGLGGIWVETLRDTSVRLLPVCEDDALSMLRELRGNALLDGLRGTPATDRAALARCIVAIGNAALALGPDLVALEVNPLLASTQGIEALDGLTVWSNQ